MEDGGDLKAALAAYQDASVYVNQVRSKADVKINPRLVE